MGHIHHHLVHADAAQDRCPLAPDQHVESAGKVSAVAVGVAHGDGGYPGGAGGDIGAAVANLPARLQRLDMGDAAEPLEGRLQGEKVRGDLLAGVHAVGDDAGANHLIVVGKIHQSGGVVQMPDGDHHIPLLQHINEPVKPLCLGPGTAQIRAVGGGKVAENALRHQSGELCDGGADICVLLGGLEADAAHAGIHGEVEGCVHPCFHSGGGQGGGILVMENGGTDALTDGGGEGGNRGLTQDQNGSVQTSLPQLQSLMDGGDAEKSTFVLKQTGYLNGTVTVGVSLDHCHNRHTGLFPDGIKITLDDIKVNFDTGIVKIQMNQLRKHIIITILSRIPPIVNMRKGKSNPLH